MTKCNVRCYMNFLKWNVSYVRSSFYSLTGFKFTKLYNAKVCVRCNSG